MKQHTIIFLLLFGLLSACGPEQNAFEHEVFEFPEIVNSQFADTIPSELFESNHVSEVFPTFAGKYKFGERIDISPEKRDTSLYREYIEQYPRIDIEDTLDITGFEIVIDYQTTIKYNKYRQDSTLYDHYPVYFINSTNTDKVFPGKDSYVTGIQEALDTEKWGEWRPIEARGYDFCGNGRWGLIVHPKEFVLVLMRKYKGDFETKLRVRFQLGENRYVSKPFNGVVNPNQFSIQDSSYLKQELNETSGHAADWLFYGASPDKKEWAEKNEK